jgi:hypothetical protein
MHEVLYADLIMKLTCSGSKITLSFLCLCPCAAPYVNKPEYVLAQQYANDIADLLAPQSGAYYDVWLDGEKFVSVYKEVSSP